MLSDEGERRKPVCGFFARAEEAPDTGKSHSGSRVAWIDAAGIQLLPFRLNMALGASAKSKPYLQISLISCKTAKMLAVRLIGSAITAHQKTSLTTSE